MILLKWYELKTFLDFFFGSCEQEHFWETMEKRKSWDVLIVTDEQIRKWHPEIAEVGRWGVCCVDEAQKLKNPKSKTLAALRAIPIMFKMLLTATPLVNGINEMWTLHSFIYQDALGDKLQKFENFPVEKPGFVLLLASVCGIIQKNKGSTLF